MTDNNNSFIQLKQKGWAEAIQKMRIMSDKFVDMQPELKQWIDFYKGFVNKSWGEKGRPFGMAWKGLSPLYSKWKKKYQGSASADLMLAPGLNLVRAATGGQGWFELLNNKEMRFGIDLNSIPYARIHQLGDKNMPQRPYMMGKDGDMPAPAYQMFKNLIDEKWNKVALA